MSPRAAIPVLLVAAAAAVAVVLFGGDDRHHVVVTVPNATNVVAGQYVREAGQIVGQVGSITPVRGGRAVRLRIDVDPAAWPLPRGTRMTLRWGGTVSYDNRYIALERGAAGGAPLAEGAMLAPSSFTVPVEFDQLLTAFTPGVRRDMRTLFRRGGIAFVSARPALRAALVSAPPAITEVNAVVQDLHADTRALDTLVRSTGSVVDAVRTANPGLGRLVTGAAATFDAVATQARGLQDTLQHAPRTLAGARQTLAHADGTLVAAGDLAQRLRPGVTEVRRIAAPLNHVLGTAVQVAPDATATLRTVRRATPTLNPLLDKVTTLLPTIGSVSRGSSAQLKCIRPYTPDIVAFFTNWGDFLSATDGRDKYIRATVQQLLPAPHNASTQTSADIAKAYPGLRYAFPRPPGYNAGQPWFLPQCGAGRDALDPAKDPESRSSGSLMGAPRLQPILPVYRRTR
jgi:ABC-type transporter Mla subunit MlaD